MFSQLCGILEQRGKSRFPRAGKRQGGRLVDARMAIHVRPGGFGDLCELCELFSYRGDLSFSICLFSMFLCFLIL